MNYFRDLFIGYELEPGLAGWLAFASFSAIIVVVCIVANFITKKIVLNIITRLITRNRFAWDDKLLERKVFHKLSHIVPAIIIYYSANAYHDYPVLQELLVKGSGIYSLLVVIASLNSFLNALHDIYLTYEISKERPIKGFIQVGKIIMFFIGGILLIATLVGQNPLFLLGGLSAFTAVLLLIFQNSILGLVAGVQLTANDMVRVGDWIEMPKYNADGDVLEITLTTVKVQNWDKTITMIPSQAFLSDSFKNWRGMQESGGRRIKRAIYVDMSSIRFCTEEMIEKFKRIHLLKDYIESKEREIEEYNREHGIDPAVRVNGRRLTNIGTFRAYIATYLANHPQIHKGMTMMVRQLAPSEHGLPLEIYAFTSDTRWAVYEGIQADIFDHILAAAPEFGLRVFQNPTGHDMRQMLENAPGQWNRDGLAAELRAQAE
jgi:miniconductance mechanosensitive channel